MAFSVLDQKLDSTSEVTIEVPLQLKIGALLRYWGYYARTGTDSHYETNHWRTPLEADKLMQIGKLVTGYKDKTVTKSERRSFLRYFRRTVYWYENEKIPVEVVHPVAGIDLALEVGAITICTYGIEDLAYLHEIAKRLQQTLRQKVVIRVYQINEVPTIQSLAQLPIPVEALLETETTENVRQLLLERVARRLDPGMKLQIEQDTIWLEENDIKRKLLVVALSQIDKTSLEIVCSVYRSDLDLVVEQETDGIAESLLAKSITLTCLINRLC